MRAGAAAASRLAAGSARDIAAASTSRAAPGIGRIGLLRRASAAVASRFARARTDAARSSSSCSTSARGRAQPLALDSAWRAASALHRRCHHEPRRPPATSTATMNSASCTPLSRASRAPVPDASRKRSLLRRPPSQPRDRDRRRARRAGTALVDAHRGRGRRTPACRRRANLARHAAAHAAAGRCSRSTARQQIARRRAMPRRNEVALRRAARTRAQPPARRLPQAATGRAADAAAAGAVARRCRQSSRAASIAPSARSSSSAASIAAGGGGSNHSSVRGSPPQAITSSAVRRQIDARDLRLAMRTQPVAGVPQPNHAARPACARRGRRADRPNPARCARCRGCRSPRSGS